MLAVNHLLGAIKILPDGLTTFDISKTGVSTKCLNKVGEMLSQSPKIIAGLTTLKLSDNGLKGEDFPVSFLLPPSLVANLINPIFHFHWMYSLNATRRYF